MKSAMESAVSNCHAASVADGPRDVASYDDHSLCDNRRSCRWCQTRVGTPSFRVQFVKVCRPSVLPSVPPPLPPTPPVSRHSRPSYPAPHATPTLSSPNLFTLTKISIYNRCRRLAERMRVNWRSTITRRVSAGNWRLFMLTGSGRAC